MGDQVSIQGNRHVNNCFTSWFHYTLLASSHQSPVSKISKQMDLGGMYENAIRNLPSKNAKEISFTESATRPEDRALAWHTANSVFTVCICHHPNATVSEISIFKGMTN